MGPLASKLDGAMRVITSRRLNRIPAVPYAAFTIASAGTLTSALALSRSYLSNHPGHRFHIVVVDAMPALAGLDPRTRIVAANDVPVPRPDTFRYQYASEAACAALKPHAMAWLLAHGSLDSLYYLGPEAFVLRPLDEAWAALSGANVVLAPRLRTAFPDREFRAESALGRLQGVFDTDFVGLRATPEASRMLDWWARELFVDCVDAPAEGFHLDRRCLDPAPWLFEGVRVLRDPAYNVGAWNLHERPFALRGDSVLVDGVPVALFNFRGHDPARLGLLGEGPSRVHVDEVPALARLLALHDVALREAGEHLIGPPGDDPMLLGNGVPMVRALSAVALQSARRRLRFPEPGSDPGGFCVYAARPDACAYGAPVAPLTSALLALRPDVALAFPEAARDPDEPGFKAWMREHGAREEGLGAYLERFGDLLGAVHPVAAALKLREGRHDLASAFPVFEDPAAHRAYGEWLAVHGPEAGLDPGVAAEFGRTEGAVFRVLDAWFSAPARALANGLPHTDMEQDRIVSTLAAEMWRLPGIDHGDLLYFAHAARARREALLLCWLRYSPAVRRAIGGPPSAFRHEAIRRFLSDQNASGFWPDVARALLSPGYVPAREQFAGSVADFPQVQALFPEPGDDPVSALERAHYMLDEYGMDDRQPGWAGWARALLEDVGQSHAPLVNVCGPLRDASGVGEAARALLRAMDAVGAAHSRAVIPGTAPGVGYPSGTTELDLYGSVDPAAEVNLLVANAVSRDAAESWFGDQFRRDQALIAVWMWETERLPARFRDAARGLEAIVAPSRFVAEAIRATVDVPVHVVPLPPDYEALTHATPQRERFGLQPEVFVLGYFFDANSVLERKNPEGVLDAFRLAFGEHSDACLVLKVNSPPIGDYDFEQLKARAQGLNVTWIDRTLSQQDTFDLMASLDAYVSLHRAEGFGLTLAEAMALAKPCVATGYSGNMDFMDDGCALLVRHRPVTTRRPYGDYPAGSHWAEPSIEDAAQHMRALRNDAGMRARLGDSARTQVHRLLDPAAIGAQLVRLCRAAAAGRPGGGKNP